MDMKITFWGVRGSKPTPDKEMLLYGGNTSCVQVESKGYNFIFDAGTGIVELGKNLIKKRDNDLHIFLSHLHWDHIQGIPFFKPIYVKENNCNFYGENKKGFTFEEVIKNQMSHPYFPITMDDIEGNCRFTSIESGVKIEFEDIVIRAFSLNHPDGCLAYRLDSGNSSMVYCTDTETMEGSKMDEFVEFIYGADVLIYDSHFTNEEYFGKTTMDSKKGWGHSTWEEGVKLSREANINTLVLFHHSDERKDAEVLKIENLAKKEFENTIGAKENMIIFLGGVFDEKVVINNPY